MIKWNEVLSQLTLLGQLGLSLAMPLLMSLAGCYLAVSKLHAPLWVYLPGMILGLGASFMTAYKMYQSVTKKGKKPRRRKEERSFNKHF